MGLLWWLVSSLGSHGLAFLLGIAAIPATIVFLFPEILTIIYRELVVKGVLYESPKYESASDIPIPSLDGGDETKDKKEEEEGKPSTSSSNSRVSGWLIVRRQYKPSKEGILFTNATTDLTGALKREKRDSNSEDSTTASTRNGEGEEDDPKLDTDAASTITTDSGITTSSNKPSAGPTPHQRTWVQAARQTLALPKRETPAKERFYCVLKGSVLYLYEDEKQSDALAVLAVDRFRVGVETSGGRFDGKDGEMFAKKNAIVMRLWQGEKEKVDKSEAMPVLAKGMTGDIQEKGIENDMEKAPWYLLSKNNSQLEDWYLALVQASALHPSMDDVFSYDDMQDLVKTIDAEQDPIPTRWLNAILGRVFFGLYRTAFVEEFIIGRIMKKLNKVVKPNWLSDITVQEVNIGTFPPFFSKPMLKDLRSDGSITFEAYLRYVARENQPNSRIRLTMAFLATIPVGFKSIQVPVVAAVIVRAMEGNMIFTIKPAPSNRIWYGFTTEPIMDIEISLMGAEWKVESSFILNQLKKFLKQAIAEVLVAPNFDDLAFFDTSKFNVRGGVFSEAGKINTRPEREDVTLKNGTPSQPGVAPKEGSELGRKVSKKRTSTHASDLAKLGEDVPKIKTDGLAPALPGKEEGNDTNRQVGLARATSISSKTLDTARPLSKGTLPARPNTVHNDHPTSTSDPSASAPNLISLSHTDTIVDSPASDRPPTITSGFHPFPKPASIKSNETRSSTSTSTATAKDIPSHEATTDAESSSTAPTSLLNSFRSRDKQAIAAQMNSAKSVVRKWGIDFAAKRRADFNAPTSGGIKGQGQGDGQGTQPQALYRPPDDDQRDHGHGHGHVRSVSGATATLGHSPNKSLQERLSDAARAAAGTSPTASSSILAERAANRERSGSTLSTGTNSSSGRPTLLASPSKSGVVEAAPSTSEPNFTTSHRSNISASAETSRRGSFNTPTITTTKAPVLMQPSAGRSMVVPRVMHRPGEVTGLGNSPGRGITRKTSDTPPTTVSGSGDIPTNQTNKEEAVPELPPRKSVEIDRSTAIGSVPPPLPGRNLDLDTDRGAGGNGEEMHRSDSAPAKTQSEVSNGNTPEREIISLSKPDEDLPGPSVSTETTDPDTTLGAVETGNLVDVGPVLSDTDKNRDADVDKDKGVTSEMRITETSGAQTALRRLAEKDQSRKEKDVMGAEGVA